MLFVRISSEDVAGVIRDLALAHPLEYALIDDPDGLGLYIAEYTSSFELRKLEVSWTRTPAIGIPQDAAKCTFHFLNLTGGLPDASWITSDYTAVESAFDTFWTGWKPYYKPEVTLSEYAWRADGPAFKPFGSALSPTLRVTPRAVAGSVTTFEMLPPQCAVSVTEVTDAHYTAYGVGVPGDTPGTGRTQVRNRWGRFYLPAPNVNAIDDGRITPGVCTELSGLVQTMYNTCVSAGLIPVMYSPTTGHAWSITQIHVDDIVDVIRSRRYVEPTTRASSAITAP